MSKISKNDTEVPRKCIVCSRYTWKIRKCTQKRNCRWTMLNCSKSPKTQTNFYWQWRHNVLHLLIIILLSYLICKCPQKRICKCSISNFFKFSKKLKRFFGRTMSCIFYNAMLTANVFRNKIADKQFPIVRKV